MNTPGTRSWSRLRDRTLAVKKLFEFNKKYFFIFLLVKPKYWGKQIFRHWSFPEVGKKAEGVQKKKEKRKKKEKK